MPPRTEIPAELELYILQYGQQLTHDLTDQHDKRIGPLISRIEVLEDELLERRAVKRFIRYAIDAFIGVATLAIGYFVKKLLHL